MANKNKVRHINGIWTETSRLDLDFKVLNRSEPNRIEPDSNLGPFSDSNPSSLSKLNDLRQHYSDEPNQFSNTLIRKLVGCATCRLGFASLGEQDSFLL